MVPSGLIYREEAGIRAAALYPIDHHANHRSQPGRLPLEQQVRPTGPSHHSTTWIWKTPVTLPTTPIVILTIHGWQEPLMTIWTYQSHFQLLVRLRLIQWGSHKHLTHARRSAWAVKRFLTACWPHRTRMSSPLRLRSGWLCDGRRSSPKRSQNNAIWIKHSTIWVWHPLRGPLSCQHKVSTSACNWRTASTFDGAMVHWNSLSSYTVGKRPRIRAPTRRCSSRRRISRTKTCGHRSSNTGWYPSGPSLCPAKLSHHAIIGPGTKQPHSCSRTWPRDNSRGSI